MRKKQLELNLNGGKHGGRRSGSGRKRIHSEGVAHRSRETVGKAPLHINFKYKVTIRNKHCLKSLKRAILNARKGGMRSVTVTFAKGVGEGTHSA